MKFLKRVLISFAIAFLLIEHCEGQAVSFGSCAVPLVVQDFDVFKFFAGTWYHQKGFGTMLFDLVGICPAVRYEINDSFEVTSLDYAWSKALQKYLTKQGRAQIPASALQNPMKGYLEFTFYEINGLLTPMYPMSIIDTDYNDYGIIYFCRSLFGLMKIEAGWIMSRQQEGTQISDDALAEIINKSGLKANQFKKENQEGCSGLPDMAS